jgi:hypothetical protein
MVAARLPSSLVAWCHRSARRFLRRASLNWPSLANSDSRASLFSIFKGEVKSKGKSGEGMLFRSGYLSRMVVHI